VTSRASGSTQVSVVNAGVLAHPVTGEPIVGFVVRGHPRKLLNLRARPRVTVVFRSGWEWVAVEGDAELLGADDHMVCASTLDYRCAASVVGIYAAAVGGKPDEWVHLDTAMAEERPTAVLVRVDRIYSNPEE
jgi:Pyridoxamine 5'-phosphate oxidase